MSVNDRYAAVSKQRLCYGCLSKGHAIKDCKVDACGIKGCIKKHNRLLHTENQMNEGNHAVNVSAATINQSNEVTSFLQIVPVYNTEPSIHTYAFLDSGSTVSFIDQSVQEKLRAQGTDVTLNIAGIHGTKDLKTEKFPLKIKQVHSNVHSFEAFAHKLQLQLQQAEAELQTLECSTQPRLQLDGSWHHPWSRYLLATTPIGLQDRNTK